MSAPSRTAAVNAPLWGARARDWAEVQEPTARTAYLAVLDHDRVGPGTAMLDVGCGSGMAARLAADRGAVVAGSDATEALLAIARERVPDGDFRLADLEEQPFEDDRFDLVTGFNAFQYAGQPVAALLEAKRVAKTGGTIAMMVWGEPAGMPMASVIAALGKLMPPPPPGAPGPFALSGTQALHDLAGAAGLAVETIVDVPGDFTYPDLDTAVRGLDSSGVAERARGAAGDAAVTAAHREALAPFVRDDGSVAVGATFRILFARA